MRTICSLLTAQLFFWSFIVQSACSPFVSRASINDIYHKTNGQVAAYVELAIIDPMVSNVDYDDWFIRACSGVVCKTFDVTNFDDTNPRLIFGYTEASFRILIDFDNGFDLSLLDGNGDMIDYIQINGYSKQNQTCSYSDLAYVYPIPATSGSTKVLARLYDGVGQWAAENGNQPTPGESNGDYGTDINLIITDETVAQGDDANFTVSLVDNDGNPTLSIVDTKSYYSTLDNTAISPTHYASSQAIILNIPSGEGSVTIPISTIDVNDGTTRDFSLNLYGSINANINDSQGIATITGDTNNSGLVAHYAMDETSWGSVLDSSGNGFDGIAYNGADTVGTSCRYGQFDGINDYIEIPHDDALNGSTALTYVAYIRADSWSGTNQIIAKSVHGGGSGRAQMGLFSEGGVFKGRAETNDGRIGIQTTLPAPLGDWVHVALVFDGTSLTIYQDGVNVANTSFSATTLKQTTDPLNISKRVGTSQYYFHGLMDDVRVYTTALTQQEIIALMASVPPCSFIDHFMIIHDGQGLTCQAEDITIKACANSDCSILDSTATDVVLSIDGVVNQTVTVIGETQTSFSHITPETVTLSLDQVYQCKNESDASTSCAIVFAEAGFVLDVDSGDDVKACTDGQLTIKALKLSDDGVSCAPAFTGEQSLNFIFDYINPISGTKTPILDSTAMPASTVVDNRLVTFDANGEASLTLHYKDAGNISLTVSENVSSGVSPATITKDFYPGKFVISSAINGTTPNDGTTQVAADIFQIDVVAQCDDLANTLTPNYQPQSVTSIKLSVIRTGPIGIDSVDGAFTFNENIPAINATKSLYNTAAIDLSASFINGAYSTTTARYSEVGLINIKITDSDYLGNTISSDALGLGLGRFIPAQFELITSGVVNSCNNLTYMDEPNLKLTYEIEAQNSADVLTQNYIEGFVHSVANLVAEDDNTTELSARLIDFNGAWDKGIYSGEEDVVPDEDQGSFSRGATLDGPFDNLFIGIKLEDTDGKSLLDLDMNVDTQDDCLLALDCTAKELSMTKSQIRFGRWTMQNSYGPETSSVVMKHVIEQYNGTSFEVNTDEVCITPAITAKKTSGTIHSGGLNLYDYRLVDLDNSDDLLTSHTDVSVDGSLFVLGLFNEFIFSAPGVNRQGSLDVEFQVPAWLQFDWTNLDNLSDGPYTQNPAATVTFGLFRGNDRIIYWREK